MNHAPSAASHPSLFFDAADVPALRARAATLMKPQLDVLMAWAEGRVDDSPPGLAGGYEKRGDTLQDPYLANTLAFSFLALMTGAARYREAARRWALSLAGMSDWVGELDPSTGRCGGCGYPEGWGLTALAVAYDFLHPHFDEEERALIRGKIASVCRGLYHTARGDDWWTGAYLHHDTWIPLGGLGLGAMAVIDEVPDAHRWAERAREELDGALDWLGDDGAWPEGPCGWAFAMISAVPFWDAYRRRFPEAGAAVLGNRWIGRSAEFRLRSRAPDGRFLAFGDCNPHGGYQNNARQAAPTLRWLAARYRDAHAQWLAAREWEALPNPYTAAWETIWMDPDVPEEPPGDLPVGARFANQEIALLRTSWEPDTTMVAFRCDSLLGRRAASLYRPGEEGRFNNSTTHVHADANSFGVWARGALAISMARYGQNASEFQNTLLVDGEGQYTRFGPDHFGRPDGRITGFFSSRAASLVSGDAARCYPPGLDRFERRVLLLEPGIIFVVDDVEASSPVDLEWRFHVDAEAALDVGEDGFVSLAEGRRTWLRLAGPRGAWLGTVSDDWNRGVRVRAGGPTSRAGLACVLLPSLPADASPIIETPSPRAFAVSALGMSALAAFASRADEIESGGLSARASAAAVIRASGGDAYFAADATRVVLDGAPLVEASAPVTLSYRRAGGGGSLTVAASAPADLLIVPGFAAAGVRTADGGPVPFTASGARLALRLPAGTSRLVITRR